MKKHFCYIQNQFKLELDLTSYATKKELDHTSSVDTSDTVDTFF